MCVAGAEMSDKRGTGDGAHDASSECNVAGFTGRDGADSTQLVDEVVPRYQIVRVELQFKSGITSADVTIELDFCGGRGNLTLSECGGSGIIYVVVVNECRGRGDSPWGVRCRSPARLAFGAEVRERSGPGVG